MPVELPVVGTAPPPERGDAARNRARVIEAAARLLREQAVEHVDMREIAAAAGVGVGTLYRRFGDKGGLVSSVLDSRARALQDAVLAGPPPLGPGAPPEERLVAFLRALVDLTEQELDLIYAVEHARPGGRLELGPYAAWRLHVAVLLEQLEPAADPEWLAEALLAPLSSSLYRDQRRRRGMTTERIQDGLAALAGAAVRRG